MNNRRPEAAPFARSIFPALLHDRLHHRVLEVTVSVVAAGSLEIFLVTQGPQVTGVGITGKPGFDLFDAMPSTAGPTPRVDSLTISLRDLPNRAAGFLYEAILAGVASNPGLYVLRGDTNGVIAVSEVIVTNAPRVPGQPATATIELRFAAPLPDDRYTLTLAGTLVDPAGNALDGESNAGQPLETPGFPSGDGQPGGSFTARFTVDSAAEIGTYSFGAAYIDINGNGVFDPQGTANDQANRDLAFAFGNRADLYFAGNFAPAGATSASGFDKLAAFGQVGGSYRFLLDFNHDGVADLSVNSLVNGNGAIAVAGNFAPGHPGDEVGLYNGQKWFLDTNGNYVLGDAGDTQLNGNMQGLPIVGDFDGDGKDDLATYKDSVFSFDLAANGLTGNTEATINFGFFGSSEQPVAADLNLDGIDDIGLFLPERNGPLANEAAEWFWLVSTGTPVVGTLNTLNHPFKSVPFGNDRFFGFGSELAKPLAGNFDPPATAVPSSPTLTLGGIPGSPYAVTLTPASPGAFALTGWTVTWGDGQVETMPGDQNTVTHDYGSAAGVFTIQATATDGSGTWSAANTVSVTVNHDSANERYVAQAFLDLLGRQVDTGGLAFWSGLLDRGMPLTTVSDFLTHSDEYFATNVIKPAYLQFLGREADDDGLAFWVARMQAGMTDQQVQAAFVGSTEFFQNAGGTNAQWVDAMYRSLLSRPADQDGKAFWVGILTAGANRADVAFGFSGSVERARIDIQSTYLRYLGRPSDPAGEDFWINAFQIGLTIEDIAAGFLGSPEYFQNASS